MNPSAKPVPSPRSLTRRSLLCGAAGLGLAALLPRRGAAASAPRIAIVGAGLAGLTTAWELAKAGYASTVYEASGRVGGRTFSLRHKLAPGLATELGGSFINTTHTSILALADELGLARLDLKAPGKRPLKGKTFWFGGAPRSVAEVGAAVEEFARVTRRELDDPATGAATARRSLADQLDRIGLTGWPRAAVEVTFVVEYGLDPAQLALADVGHVLPDPDGPGEFDLIGLSDERWKIAGGNQRLAEELARRLPGTVETGMVLEAVRARGEGYRLSFQQGKATRQVDAELVVLAVPFSVLRGLELAVELPRKVRASIDRLAHGLHTKLVIGTRSRPWRLAGQCGYAYSDEGFGLAFDDTPAEQEGPGGLTLLSGGAAALAAGLGRPADRVAELMPGIERSLPGTAAAATGVVLGMDWNRYPFAKGCFASNQAGVDFDLMPAGWPPVGRLWFAGEHTAVTSQGFMDGAVESGVRVAKEIAAALA